MLTPYRQYFKLVKCDFEVSVAALTSLLFFEIQRNGQDFRTEEVDIFDTGHHLTSHPTAITQMEGAIWQCTFL